MELPFQIPLSKNDLLSHSDEHYAVNEVYSVRDINLKFAGKKRGPKQVSDCIVRLLRIRMNSNFSQLLFKFYLLSFRRKIIALKNLLFSVRSRGPTIAIQTFFTTRQFNFPVAKFES